MGKIRELYETPVRPMEPAERLQLARLILDDLAPGEGAVDASYRAAVAAGVAPHSGQRFGVARRS
jgi:hypothetical protein